MATFNFLRWQPRPYSPSLTANHTPLEGVLPIRFHQNDRKGRTLDYLDGSGHLLFGLGATEKNSRVMVTTPIGKTRVKANWLQISKLLSKLLTC